MTSSRLLPFVMKFSCENTKSLAINSFEHPKAKMNDYNLISCVEAIDSTQHFELHSDAAQAGGWDFSHAKPF